LHNSTKLIQAIKLLAKTKQGTTVDPIQNLDRIRVSSMEHDGIGSNVYQPCGRTSMLMIIERKRSEGELQLT